MKDLINKFLGMNRETRERTVAAIVVYILDFCVVFNIIDFSSDQINAIAKVAVLAVTAVAWIASHYYNNDYTEEACVGTGITRQLKAQNDADYIGEKFYMDNIDEEVYEDEDDREIEVLDEDEEAGEVDE